MGKNTSISLGEHFEQFIQEKIDKGRYASVSEVVRAGLRLLEEEEKKLDALAKMLKAGEQSGVADNFDPEEHLNSLKHRK